MMLGEDSTYTYNTSDLPPAITPYSSYKRGHPMQLVKEPTQQIDEKSIYNLMISKFPWVESMVNDTDITSVFEFLADSCYQIGYSHGESDSGAYIAELEALVAVKSHLEPCPECGGMGFTIGFIGQKRQKFPCSTCGGKQ